MEWIASPEAWIALTTLTLLEIVLGIDNIVFISILVGRLPEAQRQRGRVLGLGFAMGTRILLLLLITWIMRLQANLFSVLGVDISGRDLILIGGGLFLIAKSTLEIHDSLEGASESHAAGKAVSFVAVIVQIALIDIVFSLDSVITAVGMADDVMVMIIAIMLAVGVMMFAAGAIGRFVDDHPTVKMLALSFLVLIGFALISEGIDLHIPKGYVYFAMAFSVAVEMLNLRMRRRRAPVTLHKRPPGTTPRE
jgi:predicted tellurium resistance membrane protein TerC